MAPRALIAHLLLTSGFLGAPLALLGLHEVQVASATPSPLKPGSSGANEAPADDKPEADEDGPKPDAKPKAAPALARVKVREEGGMLLLPGGRFPMGVGLPKSPPNERPQRIVAVSAFWMDRTEVTVGAYRACVEEKRCERPRTNSASCTYDLGDAELPVSCVRWADAEAFCKSRKKRLPTEAEWEYSARGPVGYVFPWGNRLPDCKLANTLVRDNSGRTCAARPWRVGSAPHNASIFGVLDLGGNVEEWTHDWYTERLSDLSPRSGASHSIRGGGWQSPPSRSRATTRDWGSALEAGPNIGFRCAKDP